MNHQDVENFLNRLHRDPSLELKLKGAMMNALEGFGLAPQEREFLYTEGIGRLEMSSIRRAASNGQGTPLPPAVPIREPTLPVETPPEPVKKPVKRPVKKPVKPVKKPAKKKPAKKAPKKK